MHDAWFRGPHLGMKVCLSSLLVDSVTSVASCSRMTTASVVGLFVGLRVTGTAVTGLNLYLSNFSIISAMICFPEMSQVHEAMTWLVTMSLTLGLVIVDRKGGVGRVQAQLLVMHTLFPHTGPCLDWWWWGWWPGLDAELLKEIPETWCRAPGSCRGPWNFCWLEILFYYRWHQVNLVAHIACWLS